MEPRKINCPLLGKEIEDGMCYDIHMNVEGLAPDWTMPKTVLENPGYKKICIQCQHHRDD